ASWLVAGRAPGANIIGAAPPGPHAGLPLKPIAGLASFRAGGPRAWHGWRTHREGVRLRAPRETLPQLRADHSDAAADRLEDRGEFVALRHLHADAADIDIGDFGRAASLDDIPVDENPAAVRAIDLARDNRLAAARPSAEDAERLAPVFAKPGG